MRQYFCPKVFGFDELFISEYESGLPVGSVVHISGPTGSGKTSFAFSLLRSLLRVEEDAHIYFLTPTFRDNKHVSLFSSLGWLSEQDALKQRIHLADVTERELPRPRQGADELMNRTVDLIRNLEAETQYSGIRFVVVDNVDQILKDSRDAGEYQRNVYDLIERIHDSILSESSGPERLALTVLTTGDTTHTEKCNASHRAADYVWSLQMSPIGRGRYRRILEIVKSQGAAMRIGQHSWALLNRNRISDVIASLQLRQHIRNTYFRFRVGRKSANELTSIAIFPRPKMPAIGSLNGFTFVQGEEPPDSPSDMISTGIPGLDEMLAGDTDFFARHPSRQFSAGVTRRLKPESTTLLMGKSGTGKTTACLQFLLADLPVHDSADCETSLYVNFENRPARILRAFPGSERRKERLTYTPTIYRRHAELDMNILLAEIRYLVLCCGIDRIAIDGLSDLLATLSPGDHSRFLEDLLTSIRYANRQAKDRPPPACHRRDQDSKEWRPVTVFVALEADLEEEDYSRLEAISFAADNLVSLKQVFINNEQRKTARIVKARGLAPDKQYRELVTCEGDDFPLRIVAGLENYADIHGDTPSPVLVTMQLVEENLAEREFNLLLKERLLQLFGYEIVMFGFSRGEINRTLHDISTGTARIPQSNVKILNVDEWWIGELRGTHARLGSTRTSALHQHPLLRLDMEGEDRVTELIHPEEFWVFEVEKASVPIIDVTEGPRRNDDTERAAGETAHATATASSGNKERGELAEKSTGNNLSSLQLKAEMVACPSYTDFGMLCIHSELLDVLKPDSEPVTNKTLAEALPRVWARRQKGWFAPPDPSMMDQKKKNSSIVDLLGKCTNHEQPFTVGFAFDMETPETLVCTFLEFCWAFGAREDFLIGDVVSWLDTGIKLAEHPATIAIEFLCFMVVEGLMPAMTGLKHCRDAALSRHWYSTVQEINFERSEKVPRLMPLPFFPVGLLASNMEPLSVQPALAHATFDALVRVRRLVRRLGSVVLYRSYKGQADAESLCELAKRLKTKSSSFNASSTSAFPEYSIKQIHECVELLAAVGTELRTWLLSNPGMFQKVGGESCRRWIVGEFGQEDESCDGWDNFDTDPVSFRLWPHYTAGKYMTMADALELLKWHDYRVELLKSELNGKCSDSKAGDEASTTSSISSITGYACEGSWLLGVERRTQAGALATKFIAEACSATSSADRARVGAGIPSRKDFYSIHGNESVGMRIPYSWNEILVYCGARARRRDRTLCSYVPASMVFDVIRVQLHECLSLSKELKEGYEAEASRPEQIEKIKALAVSAVKRIMQVVSEAQVKSIRDNGTPCMMCPNPNACSRIKDVKTTDVTTSP